MLNYCKDADHFQFEFDKDMSFVLSVNYLREKYFSGVSCSPI